MTTAELKSRNDRLEAQLRKISRDELLEAYAERNRLREALDVAEKNLAALMSDDLWDLRDVRYPIGEALAEHAKVRGIRGGEPVADVEVNRLTIEVDGPIVEGIEVPVSVHGMASGVTVDVQVIGLVVTTC